MPLIVVVKNNIKKMNSATRAKILERDVEYKPEWINTAKRLKGVAASSGNGAGHYSQAPIYGIHVTQNDLTVGTYFGGYDTGLLYSDICTLV